MLKDSYGRIIDYARVATTDKCNLRCSYCMPEHMQFLPKKDILSFEDIVRMLHILSSQGIKKIRYTGGEPFMRKDFLDLLCATKQQFSNLHISITTNGTLIDHYIPHLKGLVDAINVSIDSLLASNIERITMRPAPYNMIDIIHKLIDHKITTKINTVVIENVNTHEILDFVRLTEAMDISVRFIEAMPFNHSTPKPLKWNYLQILTHIKQHFDIIETLADIPHSTAKYYKVKKFVGNFGVIPAYSRTFCNTCNRIRITPQGFLKTCLYEKIQYPLISLLRNHSISNDEIATYIQECINHKPVNGFEAEQNHTMTLDTMNRIGG